MESTKTSVAAVIGLLLGIMALLFSAVPIINNFAFVLGVLGLIFGTAAIIRIKKGKSTGMKPAVSAMILSGLSLVIVLVSQQMYSSTLDEVSKQLEKESSLASGGSTDDC